MIRKTIIFDLDGTLALIDERRRKSAKPNGKINWNVFYDPKNISLDKPNYPVILMFKTLKDAGHRVVIFSGRSDQTKDETVKWLESYGVVPDMLVMRDSSTTETLYMPDDILKLGWLNQYFPDRSEILCIFDDRDKVVKMWREEGLICFQVANGDF